MLSILLISNAQFTRNSCPASLAVGAKSLNVNHPDGVLHACSVCELGGARSENQRVLYRQNEL
jgi:hypothetical protein